MNKGNLVALMLILIGGITQAEVYKWVDESGRVHFGDTPPPESDSQTVEVPEAPSREKVERAQQQMHEKIDRYKKLSEEMTPPESQDMLSEEAQIPAVGFDNLACFTPISDLVQVPAVETFKPITPTLLTKAQQGSLKILFSKADARWRGKITELRCLGNTSQPRSQIRNFEARAALAKWDKWISQLAIETESIGKESGVTMQLFRRFEVGDALYYSEAKEVGSIAQDGNKVEVLSLNRNMVSFLIKQHVPSGPHTRRPRVEIRHLEISDRKIKLIELYFYNGMLTDSTTWILHR
jgi:hypothetical protein